MRNKYIFNKFFSFVTILIFIFSTFCTKVNAQSSLFRVERSTDIKSAKIGDTFDVKYKITPEDIHIGEDNTQKDIVLVIDTSGSMKEYMNGAFKIQTMKDVAKSFVEKFANKSGFNIGLVEYSSYSAEVIPLTNMGSGSYNIKNSIDRLETGGATNIGDGIRAAKVMLDRDISQKEKYIILMTDGVATAYSRDKNKRKEVYEYYGWIKEKYLDDYMGAKVQANVDHVAASRGYTLDTWEYITYNGIQERTDPDALRYAKNVVNTMIKDDKNIKFFYVVGFGSEADCSNDEIARAAGGYIDGNGKPIDKGKYYNAQDNNNLKNLYDEFATNIDKTIHGKAHFQESISSNLEIVDSNKLPYGLKIQDNKIIGDIDIEYTLDGSYYKANPIEFTIKYKAKSSGNYVLGQGGRSSFVEMKTSDYNEKQYFDEVNLQFIGSPEIKISVTDATGMLDNPYIVDETSSQKRINKFLSNEVKLKGDSYANISFKSQIANLFQYKIMSYGQNPSNVDINALKDWETLDLNKETINDDVIKEEQGYLCQRAYDVSHLQTIGEQDKWEDPEMVFKYPFDATIHKSTKCSTSKYEYGKLESYLKYDKTVSKRWVSNSVFLNNMDIGGEYKEASKFWGYIKVPSDGEYSFGALSDDGCKVYITANGETKMAVDNFKIQESTWNSTGKKFMLREDNFYPIYIEYSNWGGRADLRLKYNYKDNSEFVPAEWFYPSKTLTPGEYGKTIFTGISGIKLPKEAGKYYIVYRTGEKDSNNEMKNVIREGFYGGFTVEAKSEFDSNRQLVNQDPRVGEELEIRYTITPKPIDIKSIYPNGDAPQNYKSTVTEFKYQDKLPEGIKAIDKPDSNIIINGQGISKSIPDNITYTKNVEGTKYEANSITFSVFIKADENKQYVLAKKDSIITYKDIDGAQKQTNFNDLTIELKNLSSILRQGVFTKNNPLNQYVYENNNGTINVVKGIKESAATIVDCKSKNPNIKVTINGNINEDEIVFKKYKLISGVMDTSSLQNFNGKKLDLKNGVELKSDKLTFDENQKYIIIYDITPGGNEGDQITIESKITDKQGDAKKTTLLINGLPDVH